MTLFAGKKSEDGNQKQNLDELLLAIAKQNELLKNQAKMIELQSARIEDLEKKHAHPGKGGFTAEDLANFGKAIVEAKSKSDDIDYSQGIYEEQIDKDDFDPKGVQFTSPCAGYVIVDDIRNGFRVLLPYNKPNIFFEHASTRRIQQGKYESICPLSTYKSHSKKEQEWLRKHSLYNVMFYESTTGAANRDAIRASRMAVIMNHIKNYEMFELINVCNQHGCPIDSDPSITRYNLATIILDKQVEVEGQNSQRVLNETHNNMLASTQHEQNLQRT